MNTWTLGPWKVNLLRWPDGSLNGEPTVYAPNGKDGGRHVCKVYDNGQLDANARLISLAPEMAEALRDELEALRVWRTGNDLPQDVRAGIHISIDKIERLLARLEGGEK